MSHARKGRKALPRPKTRRKKPFDPNDLLKRIVTKLEVAGYAVKLAPRVRVVSTTYGIKHFYDVEFEDSFDVAFAPTLFEPFRDVLAEHYTKKYGRYLLEQETYTVVLVGVTDSGGEQGMAVWRNLTSTTRFHPAFTQMEHEVSQISSGYQFVVGVGVHVKKPEWN